MENKSRSLVIFIIFLSFGLFFLWPFTPSQAWKTQETKRHARSAPLQGPSFDHQLHTQKVGLDCRYCHTGVEKRANAGLPSVESCIGCHAYIQKDSPKLKNLRQSYLKDRPLSWNIANRLPDHAHFHHGKHIRAKIDCQTCHGEVTQKSKPLGQEAPLTMQWCLDCHQNPQSATNKSLKLPKWTPSKSAKMRNCQLCHH